MQAESEGPQTPPTALGMPHSAVVTPRTFLLEKPKILAKLKLTFARASTVTWPLVALRTTGLQLESDAPLWLLVTKEGTAVEQPALPSA